MTKMIWHPIKPTILNPLREALLGRRIEVLQISCEVNDDEQGYDACVQLSICKIIPRPMRSLDFDSLDIPIEKIIAFIGPLEGLFGKGAIEHEEIRINDIQCHAISVATLFPATLEKTKVQTRLLLFRNVVCGAFGIKQIGLFDDRQWFEYREE